MMNLFFLQVSYATLPPPSSPPAVRNRSGAPSSLVTSPGASPQLSRAGSPAGSFYVSTNGTSGDVSPQNRRASDPPALQAALFTSPPPTPTGVSVGANPFRDSHQKAQLLSSAIAESRKEIEQLEQQRDKLLKALNGADAAHQKALQVQASTLTGVHQVQALALQTENAELTRQLEQQRRTLDTLTAKISELERQRQEREQELTATIERLEMTHKRQAGQDQEQQFSDTPIAPIAPLDFTKLATAIVQEEEIQRLRGRVTDLEATLLRTRQEESQVRNSFIELQVQLETSNKAVERLEAEASQLISARNMQDLAAALDARLKEKNEEFEKMVKNRDEWMSEAKKLQALLPPPPPKEKASKFCC